MCVQANQNSRYVLLQIIILSSHSCKRIEVYMLFVVGHANPPPAHLLLV